MKFFLKIFIPFFYFYNFSLFSDTQSFCREPKTLIGREFKQFSLGYGHSLALADKGEVYSWGWNKRGQLGLSDTEDRLTPSLVTALEDKNITRLSTQDFDKHHSIVLNSDSRVFA